MIKFFMRKIPPFTSFFYLSFKKEIYNFNFLYFLFKRIFYFYKIYKKQKYKNEIKNILQLKYKFNKIFFNYYYIDFMKIKFKYI